MTHVTSQRQRTLQSTARFTRPLARFKLGEENAALMVALAAYGVAGSPYGPGLGDFDRWYSDLTKRER